MPAIHQLVHSFVEHDATSNHARLTQEIIHDLGFDSEIFSYESRGKNNRSLHWTKIGKVVKDDDLLIYQFAAESPIADELLKMKQRLMLAFHNITPFELVYPWEPDIAPELLNAMEQLEQLKTRAELTVSMSKYSQRQLHQLGFTRNEIAPVLFELPKAQTQNDVRLRENLIEQTGKKILYVGRVAPHKCQHDLIKSFFVFNRYYQPDSHLYIVGGSSSDIYHRALVDLITELDMNDSIHLIGRVTDAQLATYYENADLFASLSEHEGFGVPLIESMMKNVPVCAFDAAAIGETIGNGGLVIEKKYPEYVASAWNTILSSRQLRDALIQKGKSRVDEFTFNSAKQRWEEIIFSFVNGGDE